LKQTAIIFAVALFAAILGAAGYAHYQSLTAQNMAVSPAQIIDGRISQSTGQIIQFPPFTIHPGKADADGVPTTNARLCVKTETQCFALHTRGTDPQTAYVFGLSPEAKQVFLDSGGSVIFFSGTFSAGGSGILESFALLQYDNHGKIVNLLPPVYLTDGGDRQVWQISGTSMPIITFAEHIWGEGEPHYGNHFWTISAYVFDAKAHRYLKRTQYITARKYSDDGDGKALSVLQNEKSTITAKLTRPESSNVEQAQTDNGKSMDYGPSIPISSLRDPSLALAPTLHNTGDSNCTDKEYNLHPCTDEEVAEAQKELQLRWNSFPEWLRRKCISFTTLKSFANCEVTETVRYLNTHPGEKAPWEGFSRQPVSKQ
jgi:hypothetical protein